MTHETDRQQRAIQLWLFAVAALVLAMVLVGGATRLTESGLSITEWQPVFGVVPPLNDGAWQVAFAKYRAIPQYRELNAGISLAAFKSIFWWEWAHRLLGRLIGVAFLVPFLWFLWCGDVPPPLRGRLWFIFALGALQGVVGWWMVASGLAERVEVSQYRLATHLILACTIYVALIWTALGLTKRKTTPVPWRTGAGAIGLLVLVLMQIYLGALVAGLRAGYVYNTWPLIDGTLLPSNARLFFDAPLWRNFFENALTVQFDHRMLAYLIWISAGLHALDAVSSGRRGLTGAVLLFGALTLQVALGIWTVLLVAPLPLSFAHQAMAMVALTIATVHAARVFPATQGARAGDAAGLAIHTAGGADERQ